MLLIWEDVTKYLLNFNVIMNYKISISQIYPPFTSKSQMVLKQVYFLLFILFFLFITSISISKSEQKKKLKRIIIHEINIFIYTMVTFF